MTIESGKTEHILSPAKELGRVYKSGNLSAVFLPTGDILEITNGSQMLNSFCGNCLDGAISNIYLRIYRNGSPVKAYPLRGLKSLSKLSFCDDGAVFYGCAEDVEYTLKFFLSGGNKIFWQLELCGDKTVDAVYIQDTGCADKGFILNNELYAGQYLGHRVFETSQNGFAVTSRQNLSQSGAYPYMAQGSLGVKTIRYATDAMQFYGKSYKLYGEPELLLKDLPNVNYQFEMPAIALQTEKIDLKKNEKKRFAFFIHTLPSVDKAVDGIYNYEEIRSAYDSPRLSSFENSHTDTLKIHDRFSSPLRGLPFSDNELNGLFPEKRLCEYDGETLLSFFSDNHSHVVLGAKELATERPHGNIITTAVSTDELPDGLLTSTNYIFGVFNSQIVCGNTSFNKFTSVSKGLLNLQKHSGQRIYAEIRGKYRLLDMPSAYEMGLNYSRWYYKTDRDIIRVCVFAHAGASQLTLEITSLNGTEYSYIITNQLLLGSNEFENDIVYSFGNDTLCFTAGDGAFSKKYYPDLNYRIAFKGAGYTVSDDRIFYSDNVSRNPTLVTVSLKPSARVKCLITGGLTLKDPDFCFENTLENEIKNYAALYDNLLSGLKLEKKNSEKIEKLNETIYWYAHNAMIHYAVPHGLEQTGGAAWGTRDICQGPIELFLSTGHFNLAKKTLLKVFSYQTSSCREWPQWFMFDNYPIAASDCHGDVVFWPLKALSDYIEKSGDTGILDSPVPYFNSGTGASENEEPLLSHVWAAVDTIKKRFLPGSGLITYEGGDWDDTLQPINKEFKENLVSAWTVALAYQTLNSLSAAIRLKDNIMSEELAGLSASLKTSFESYLIKDGVIAGFGHNDSGNISLMLHPDDKDTGIKYRLLPLTRSIIARLADKEQAEKNYEIIHEKLSFPDGVRLMDRPARYEGGISKIFARAEQAANVGREISLQYVHAHIRYIESMAHMGKADDAWNGLFVINPVKISDVVPNAAPRQSNVYFSSSDGMFTDRYDYAENFDKLKDGSVKVRGGWRIYSSGGGIYLSRLISDLLGIRFCPNGLIFDPVLPSSEDGLKAAFNYLNTRLNITYRIKGNVLQKVLVNGKEAITSRLDNPYRAGGLMLNDFLNGEPEIFVELIMN